MDNQKMVERFEEAFLDGKSRDNPLVSSQLHRGADGLYFNFQTRVMFNWFVKGAASVVVELPQRADTGLDTGGWPNDCGAERVNKTIAACALAIAAAGGKVKS